MKKTLAVAFLLILTLSAIQATSDTDKSPFLINIDNLSNEEKIKAMQPYRKALDEEVQDIFKDNKIQYMGSVVRCCVLKSGNFGIEILFTAIYPEQYVYSSNMYSERHAKKYLDNIIELIKPVCNDTVEFWEIRAILYCPNYANLEDVSTEEQIIVSKRLLFNSTENKWTEEKYE